MCLRLSAWHMAFFSFFFFFFFFFFSFLNIRRPTGNLDYGARIPVSPSLSRLSVGGRQLAPKDKATLEIITWSRCLQPLLLLGAGRWRQAVSILEEHLHRMVTCNPAFVQFCLETLTALLISMYCDLP